MHGYDCSPIIEVEHCDLSEYSKKKVVECELKNYDDTYLFCHAIS